MLTLLRGETSDGTYKVFVEIERTDDASDHIMELIDGVAKLADTDDMRFRYYKNFKSQSFSKRKFTRISTNDRRRL